MASKIYICGSQTGIQIYIGWEKERHTSSTEPWAEFIEVITLVSVPLSTFGPSEAMIDTELGGHIFRWAFNYMKKDTCRVLSMHSHCLCAGHAGEVSSAISVWLGLLGGRWPGGILIMYYRYLFLPIIPLRKYVLQLSRLETHISLDK